MGKYSSVKIDEINIDDDEETEERCVTISFKVTDDTIGGYKVSYWSARIPVTRDY